MTLFQKSPITLKKLEKQNFLCKFSEIFYVDILILFINCYSSGDTDRPPIFPLLPHVMSSEKEIEYLRTVSELLIMFLLPRTYSLSPTKYLIREILSCKGILK